MFVNASWINHLLIFCGPLQFKARALVVISLVGFWLTPCFLVFQFQLVCDNTYKISLSTTIFFLGVFAGAFVFGFISDQIGRKKTLALCLYVQIPVSFGIAFAPNWITFCVLRFILGVWLQVSRGHMHHHLLYSPSAETLVAGWTGPRPLIS